MKTITAHEAKTNFGELLLSAQREPVFVTKNGKPAAVVLSQADYEAMSDAAVLAASDAQFPPDHAEAITQVLKHSKQQISQGNYVLFNGSLGQAMSEFEAKHDGASN